MKALLPIFFIITLIGCFKKKSPDVPDISTWLEAYFPGKFSILHSGYNHNIMDYHKELRQSLVADKTDSEVQLLLDWDEKTSDLGLSPGMVQRLWEREIANTVAARKLHKLFINAGFENIAVGVDSSEAYFVYVLIFKEPTPEQRDIAVRQLMALSDSLKLLDIDNVSMSFMEPDTYHSKFEYIIPSPSWSREYTWHIQNSLFITSWDLATSKPDPWKYNVYCERTNDFNTMAAKSANIWSAQNLHKPFYLELENYMQYAPVFENPLVIRFWYPFFDTEPEIGYDNPNGYVSGIYHVDKRTFTGIKVVKE